MQPCEGSQSGTGGPQTGAVVPMFPLPGVFLFPGTLMPLHIFEPRYRRMIEDSLDGPGRIVMATVLEGHEDELNGAPPVHHIAGLGEIMRHERLPDGRFLILLAGVSRVLIREIPSRAPYRNAEAIPLREVPPSSSRESELRTRIRRALEQRTREPVDVPEDLPIGQLVDLLLIRLELAPNDMQDLFSITKIEERARRALEFHGSRPRGPRAAPGQL
jgi:Lon protease-like protein